jgi:segregation and condensation protein B
VGGSGLSEDGRVSMDETRTHDTRALEALFFVSDEPIAASVLAQTLEMDRRTVEALCDRLAEDLEERGSGLVLRNVAGGWRLYTHPDTAPVVERFVLSSRQARLTKAALETLAIVAYKQPVTRHQVSGIRGVNSDGVLRALVDRGLVEEAGRDEAPGRPALFATTPDFLERLGLPSLAALPSLAPLLGIDEVAEAEGTPADRVLATEDEASEPTADEDLVDLAEGDLVDPNPAGVETETDPPSGDPA